QDMGAAGLTCSSVEMGDKCGLGVRLDLEKVPVRETAMTAYEMMLSESQERMLMVLRPEKEAEAKAVFDKWDLDFAIVGETLAEDRFLVVLNGDVKADLPLATLSGSAPEYDRPWTPTPAAAPLGDMPDWTDPTEDLLTLIGSPNYCSRRWVWEQYDNTVMADTVVRPGADAAIVRVHGTNKALAFTSDVTPRYCRANPVEGGKQAVAEAYRNLCASGARALAATDNLNFGNPEKPEIMGQFVGCVQGVGEACEALGAPIVSGNVSLYNETDGAAILPTPTIGMVGLIDEPDQMIGMTPNAGDALVVIGRMGAHLGQSAWLAEVHGRVEGDAPAVDLAAERLSGETVLALKSAGLITAAHDLSDGGLAVAAAEMALACGTGVKLASDIETREAAWFFGEDQGRYLVACARADLGALLAKAADCGAPARHVGKIEGDMVVLADMTTPLSNVKAAFEGGFAALMR
ncbi:MAG: AIR synthase-related protein, partial [Pseudomonadota bacterium]